MLKIFDNLLSHLKYYRMHMSFEDLQLAINRITKISSTFIVFYKKLMNQVRQFQTNFFKTK